jgi:hypothetical protein
MNAISRFDKQITDATDKIVIRVTPQDIKGAVCRDHQRCVIARAILRQRSSTAKWVDVGNVVVLIGTGKKTGKRYFLGNQAKKQVKFFDLNDGRAAPCAVTLNTPSPRKKIGAQPKGRASGAKKSSGKRRSKPTR